MNRKLIAGGAVLAALFAGAGAIVPATADAATKSCKSSSCEGKDPHTYGCDKDASNVHEFTLNNHRTILRYSKKCNAFWSLATPSQTGPDDPVEVRSYAKVGVPVRYEYRKKYTTTVAYAFNQWTDMVSGSYAARACEYDLVPEYSGGTRKLYCTAYVS